MNTEQIHEFTTVWGEVKQWPASMRVSLASRILQSLESEVDEPTDQRSRMTDLIGAMATDQPPPTDDDVKKILEEERLRKYG